MTGSRSRQGLKVLGASLLVLCAFEACSSDEGAAPNPFDAPPTLEIAGISLGNGGDGSVLACDNNIGVTLAFSNWRPEPPGKCGSTPQCGQVRVSLLDGPNGAELASTSSAAIGVNLDLTPLVENGTLKSGSYAIQAELVDDAGRVYPITDGGNNTAARAFTLSLNRSCASGGAGASSGGASGEGGMGGMPSFESGGAGDALAGTGGAA